AELQELMKQYHLEQLQLSQLLERFPYYVMIVNREDLTVQTLNPAYKELLGGREVAGLPVSELFSGDDLDQLVLALKKAAREGQAVHTPPIYASVIGGDGNNSPAVHTVVPISDETGNSLNRLFIYTEKPE